MNIQTIFLVLSFLLTAILGKITIPILKKLKVSQSERDVGPRSHLRKKGTPTMGGVMIILSIIIMTAVLYILKKDFEIVKPAIIVSLATLGFGIVGFIDDFKKVVLHNTEGLNPKLKMFGLLVISVLYVIILKEFTNLDTELLIPFTEYTLVLPEWLYILFTIFVILGTTNAVNLTDGVDGLAGSVSTIILTALSIIAIKFEFTEISIFSAIMTGSCVGFLIYNFYKAKVMMGDTGSLLLGGAISSIAIYLKIPIFLIIIAIVPVIETISVILQVLYFRKTGKRLFRMTPLHHHFELTGWRENKVVVVFSFVTLIASIIGVFAC